MLADMAHHQLKSKLSSHLQDNREYYAFEILKIMVSSALSNGVNDPKLLKAISPVAIAIADKFIEDLQEK